MSLYRKYRPATFAEVVGQQHVTEPLSNALDSGHINHAYLFSGPRGCGKTSSARILARSLNCVHGPTSKPCGQCSTCVALSPEGNGHVDVLELDAATHNGVDEMRVLRESAYFAPAEARYRVIILDEAHMLSNSAFNALLKIIEEPPEHLIFIFATTEPESLLATIRSRTHNYPFRLLAPPDMRYLLQRVMSTEDVPVEDMVYPLVIRAGAGSPRDALSVMDQLLSGSGPQGVTYQDALAQLGVTDVVLIDRAVDALTEHDQAELFGVVDDVIESGYDPRRFAEDLLDRFRDLLIVQAVPDALDRGLVNVPDETHETLIRQSDAIGQATLTRSAALVNEALGQMRGATAPRLLLEIVCARLALPGAGMTVEALAQRVEALEAGAAAGGSAGGAGGAGGANGAAPRRRYERPSKRRAAEQAETAKQAATPGPEPAAEPAPEPAAQQAPQPAPAPAADAADERLAEARHIREIRDRNRQARAAEPQQDTAPQQDSAERNYAAEWAAALDKLKEQNLDVWIAARTAQVREQQPEGQELHVDHSTVALARYITTPDSARALAEALPEGITLRVFVAGKLIQQEGDAAGKAPQAAEPATAQPAPAQPAPAQPAKPTDPLEIARAMATAHTAHTGSTRPQPQATPKKPAPQQQAEPPQSGWRARMKQAQQRADYNRENGFNGVPLPEEPPEEDPGFTDYPADPGQDGVGGSVAAASEEQIREREQNELLEDLENSSGQADHRTPLDVASDMIEKYLGGERVR